MRGLLDNNADGAERTVLFNKDPRPGLAKDRLIRVLTRPMVNYKIPFYKALMFKKNYFMVWWHINM